MLLGWSLQSAAKRAGAFPAFGNSGLLAAVVDTDKGNRCGKDEVFIALLEISRIDLHQIPHGCGSHGIALHIETEQGALGDAFFEFDAVHGDGHEVAAGEFHARGNICDFIHPLQHVAAEEEAIVVQVFRQYDLEVFHAAGRTPSLCGLQV